jgi:methionyl aminopeptidase
MKPNLNNQIFQQSDFVKLKDKYWLERLRIAGNCVASVMASLETLVKEKTNLSLIEISKYAENEIIKQDCLPTFLGYKGFSAAVCISLNDELVHGLPNDRKLQDGDLVSFDFGATYKGAIADSAITMIYGEPKSKEHIRLIETTKDCLYAGINSIGIGKRIGVIGNAIYKLAKDKGYSVVDRYGGHGLDDNAPHAHPFVSNKSTPDKGIRIQNGLCIAIEPLLVIGSSNETSVENDGWTVKAKGICSHFEHTLYIDENGIETITKRENEQGL